MNRTKIIDILNNLALQPIEQQDKIIKRFYGWYPVFASKIHVAHHSRAKLEFNRIIQTAKLSDISLGEQIALELQNPNEFLLHHYKAFLESAMYVAGVKEEQLPILKEMRAEEVAKEEILLLLLSTNLLSDE